MKRYNLRERDWTLSGGDGTPALEWTKPCPLFPVILIDKTDCIMAVKWEHDKLFGFGDYEYKLIYQMVGDNEIQTSGWIRENYYDDLLLNHDADYEFHVILRRSWIRNFDLKNYVVRESDKSEKSIFRTNKLPPVPIISELDGITCSTIDVHYSFPRSTCYNSRILFQIEDSDEVHKTEYRFHHLEKEVKTIKDLLANRPYTIKVEVKNRMSFLTSISNAETATTIFPSILVF